MRSAPQVTGGAEQGPKTWTRKRERRAAEQRGVKDEDVDAKAGDVCQPFVNDYRAMVAYSSVNDTIIGQWSLTPPRYLGPE